MESTNLRLPTALGLESIAILGYQLALMQILSMAQWYHFAYMVISVALLGFGAAGSAVSLWRKWLLARANALIPFMMILSGLAMGLAVWISQFSPIQFDTHLFLARQSHIWRLFLSYLLFFVPFFCGALAIGLAFVRYVDFIGQLYCANLLGSAFGGISALGLMWLVAPEKLPLVIGLLAVIAGIVLLPDLRLRISSFLIAIVILIIGFRIIPELKISEFKDISKVLNLSQAEIVRQNHSPYGKLEIVRSPALRQAPGISLNFQGILPPAWGIFNNGDWIGAYFPDPDTNDLSWMAYTTNELPFVIKDREKALILGAGEGLNLYHAGLKEISRIVAVEFNPEVNSLFRNIAENGLFKESFLSKRTMSDRTFLMSEASQFDLIMLPTIGAFGGTMGLFAMQEQYLLTKQSFHRMWSLLTDQGAISVTCWMDYPLRKPLRVLSTLVEILDEQGIENPESHISAVRSWGTITFVLNKSELTPSEVETIRDFCRDLLFDPVILPGLVPGERTAYNDLQDESFFDYIDKIMSGGRDRFYSRYDFDVRPATDNRPYFSQFIKLNRIPQWIRQMDIRTLPFYEIGYYIVIVTLAQIMLCAVLLIIVPLARLGWETSGKTTTFMYFGGIALGYMFVEIVLIQKFVLYFGSPVYSAAAVLGAILLCSGIGSYLTYKVPIIGKKLAIYLILVIGAILVYAMILDAVLHGTIQLPETLKFLFTLLIIGPVAVFMGMPFPIGLSRLSKTNGAAVPWAWGINGCVSVVSAVMATVVAVELGFIWVMCLAALGYAAALSTVLQAVRVDRQIA